MPKVYQNIPKNKKDTAVCMTAYMIESVHHNKIYFESTSIIIFLVHLVHLIKFFSIYFILFICVEIRYVSVCI